MLGSEPGEELHVFFNTHVLKYKQTISHTNQLNSFPGFLFGTVSWADVNIAPCVQQHWSPVRVSGRRSSREHYLHHRCSPGLSSHWQPHKACLETDDSATKTTQVAGCRPPGAEKLDHTKISGRHHREEGLEMGDEREKKL